MPLGFAGLLLLMSLGSASPNIDIQLMVDAQKVAICGPRAAHRVLEYFGNTESLLSIVDEMQPSPKEYVSLGDIVKCLEKRGLHVHLLRAGSAVRIDWKWPVICHVADTDPGHFVVGYPLVRGSIRHVWWGPGEIKSYSEDTFAEQRSAYVALISPKPITENDVASALTVRPMSFLDMISDNSWLLFVVVAVYYVWCASRRLLYMNSHPYNRQGA